jgi:hypothetical protein
LPGHRLKNQVELLAVGATEQTYGSPPCHGLQARQYQPSAYSCVIQISRTSDAWSGLLLT